MLRRICFDNNPFYYTGKQHGEFTYLTSWGLLHVMINSRTFDQTFYFIKSCALWIKPDILISFEVKWWYILYDLKGYLIACQYGCFTMHRWTPQHAANSYVFIRVFIFYDWTRFYLNQLKKMFNLFYLENYNQALPANAHLLIPVSCLYYISTHC